MHRSHLGPNLGRWDLGGGWGRGQRRETDPYKYLRFLPCSQQLVLEQWGRSPEKVSEVGTGGHTEMCGPTPNLSSSFWDERRGLPESQLLHCRKNSEPRSGVGDKVGKPWEQTPLTLPMTKPQPLGLTSLWPCSPHFPIRGDLGVWEAFLRPRNRARSLKASEEFNLSAAEGQ